MYDIRSKTWQEKLIFSVYLFAIAFHLIAILLTKDKNIMIYLFMEAVVLALAMWFQLFVLGCILDNKNRSNFCTKLADFIAVFVTIFVCLQCVISVLPIFMFKKYPNLKSSQMKMTP